MKKLGQGWQYTTYDLENGRVLKKFHSLIKSYWVLSRDMFPFNSDPLWELPGFSRNSKEKALASLEILKKGIIPSEWIGNPKFLNGLDYEQDKARPLHDVFLNLDTGAIKSLIDEFITFNKKLLDKGIIDKGFNITKNYG